jgi:putative membrane protein
MMRSYLFPVIAALSFSSVGFGAASAETKAFLLKVHSINQAEIKAGGLAQKQASNQDIKDFGKNVKKMEADHNDLVKKLSKLNGTNFDKEYTKAMHQGHGDAAEMLRKAKNDLTDPDAKALAGTLLPTVENHLDRATELDKVAH